MRSEPMVDEPAELFRRLQTLLLRLDGLDVFLAQAVELVVDHADGSLSCSVTARYESAPMTVVASDRSARALDERQYADDRGPCLEAMSTGREVEARDLATEQRWPAYVRDALGSGLRSLAAFPLLTGDGCVGALNVYDWESSGPPDPARRQRLRFVAGLLALCIPLVSVRVREAEVREQLEAALASRSHIDQALGVLMGQQGCTADEAFALLRRRSQSSNEPVREVAVALITRASGRPPAPARGFRQD